MGGLLLLLVVVVDERRFKLPAFLCRGTGSDWMTSRSSC
jgi:hypothetical protein